MIRKLSALLALSALLFTACNNPKGDDAETKDAQQPATATETAAATGIAYRIDASNSKVQWTGTKPTGKHMGLIPIESGTIDVKDNVPVSGNLTLQLTGLNVTDLQGEEKGKLEGHLKSPDFFDVAQFPSAKFEITSVAPFDASKEKSVVAGATHSISGNLTLKGKTQNVTFPAKVTVTGESLMADAQFNIDRTEWDLNYKGPNNPQDWVISKEVGLMLSIKANKQ